MKKYVLLLSSIAILSSCSKQKNADTPIVKPNWHSLARTGDDLNPGNSANIYDSIGICHNIVLDTLKQYVLADSDTALTHICAYASTLVIPPYQAPTIVKPGDVTNVLNGNYTITDQAIKQYAAVLDNIMANYPNYPSYATYKADVISLENQIIIDRALNQQQKALLLKTTSVARWTFAYWEASGASKITSVSAGVADVHATLVTGYGPFAGAVSMCKAISNFWAWLRS